LKLSKVIPISYQPTKYRSDNDSYVKIIKEYPHGKIEEKDSIQETSDIVIHISILTTTSITFCINKNILVSTLKQNSFTNIQKMIE
jgi:hypothetical protein